LKEHDESIISQVHPLVDEINIAADQLLNINIDEVIGNCRQKLDKWREDCHTLVDQFYQEKCGELQQRCVEKITKQQKEIEEIKAKINNLLREKEVTHEDIPLLKATINDIKRDVKQFEEKGIIVDVHPLIIKQDLVYIEQWSSNEVDISTLSSPFQKIDCFNVSLANNNQFLIFYQPPNLCLFDRDLTLVRESAWKHDRIVDMCWSSTLDSFIIISSKQESFLVNENLTSIQPIETIGKKKWIFCTCSDATLFLSTNELGSNIYAFSLFPWFRLIKRWKSPESCKSDEHIHNIASNNEKLALIIADTSNNKLRIELRSSTTLDQFWSLPLDITRTTIHVIRVCLLRCDEWLVMDDNTSFLLHISKDGKLKTTRAYTSKPYNGVLFGSNILAIKKEDAVDFYRV
jgi:hypothetical protein